MRPRCASVVEDIHQTTASARSVEITTAGRRRTRYNTVTIYTSFDSGPHWSRTTPRWARNRVGRSPAPSARISRRRYCPRAGRPWRRRWTTPHRTHNLSYEKCCPLLARRWDGKGAAPWCLFRLIKDGTWNDPSVLPSARARERIAEAPSSGKKLEALIGNYPIDQGS